MTLPILYSFRRCPYAMRARFALKMAGITCALREVDLKNKTESLLTISPKGTVPVLVLPSGRILDESLHIIEWALEKKDDAPLDESLEAKAQTIIRLNDTQLVGIAHRYKYCDKYPDVDFAVTEKNLYEHLEKFDHLIGDKQFFLGDTLTKADIAIFPFIRQIVQIAPEKFAQPSLKNLMRWLDSFLKHPIFSQVMAKYPVWRAGDEEQIF